jgi:hypothetical protein
VARPRIPIDDGPADEIRWRDADANLVRCEPPQYRRGGELTRQDVVAWAKRWRVPVDAALMWYARPDRGPARISLLSVVKGDVDPVELAPRYLRRPR